MSWILAAFDAPAHICESARGLVSQTPSSLFEATQAGSFIAAGGIPETCHFHLDADNSGWISVGAGLNLNNRSVKVITQEDWQHRFSTQSCDLPANGHFAALTWNDSSVEAFTDPLGVRTLYYAALEQGIVISTRLDWIAQLSKHQTIDFETYGSHWLTFNQLNFESPILGIKRLGSGGVLAYKDQQVKASFQPWSPKPTSPDAFIGLLRAFSNPVLPDGIHVSLGLSGGLDSRALFALLDEETSGGIHSFGISGNPDVQVARALSNTSPLSHRVVHKPVPPADKCLALVRDAVVHNQVLTPASSVLGLRYYPALRSEHLAIIDGGFGEAARRQFMNRLLRTGKKVISDKRFEAVLPFIATHRADLFAPDIKAQMTTGVTQQFAQAWDELPDTEEFGLENKLDLFSTRTRLPNFFGYEQNRLDNLILNYMPFAQPAFLDVVFSTPVKKRKEGKMFKTIIRNAKPELSQYPLVKGAYTYPFSMPATGAFFWTKIKSFITKTPANSLQHQFLFSLREYVLDVLSSNDTRQYAPYDLHKITHTIHQYYAGHQEFAGFVDWWLAFEVWRQEIKSHVT